jgi:hypothetical protein
MQKIPYCILSVSNSRSPTHKVNHLHILYILLRVIHVGYKLVETEARRTVIDIFFCNCRYSLKGHICIRSSKL